MDNHRNPPPRELETKRDLFNRTVSIVYRRIYKGTPPTKQPLSVLEATLVGVSFNVSHLESIADGHLRRLQDTVLRHEEFSEKRLVEGLSGKSRVIGRIEAVRKIFSDR